MAIGESKIQSAYEFLGLEQQGLVVGKKGKVVNYCRVSTPGQKDNLARQIERMIEFSSDKFNVSPDEITTVKDIGSAFSSRRGLLRVIDMMLAGEVSYLCFEFQDRLFRVGSEGSLIRHIAESNGVQLIAAKQTIDSQDDKTWLVTELTDYICVISNRLSAAKSSETLTVIVADEVRAIILERFNRGDSINSIYAFLKDAGYESNRNRPYSYSKIRDTIKEQKRLSELELPETVVKEKVKVVDSAGMKDFADHSLCFSSTYQEFTALVYEAAKVYFQGQGYSVPSRSVFTALMKETFGIEPLKASSGQMVFPGVGVRIIVETGERPRRKAAKQYRDRMAALINEAAGKQSERQKVVNKTQSENLGGFSMPDSQEFGRRLTIVRILANPATLTPLDFSNESPSRRCLLGRMSAECSLRRSQNMSAQGRATR